MKITNAKQIIKPNWNNLYFYENSNRKGNEIQKKKDK